MTGWTVTRFSVINQMARVHVWVAPHEACRTQPERAPARGISRSERAPARGTPRSRRVRGVSCTDQASTVPATVYARRPARVDRTAPGWYVFVRRVILPVQSHMHRT